MRFRCYSGIKDAFFFGGTTTGDESELALGEFDQTFGGRLRRFTGTFHKRTMREQILDECLKRGACPLNRKQFDETFSGYDLTIQMRSAIDFAQQNDLALGRSTGDQHFVFYRLSKSQETTLNQRPSRQKTSGHRARRRSQARRKPSRAYSRPFGRSF